MEGSPVRFDLGSLLNTYERDEKTREMVAHNASILKCIRGGFRMAERQPIGFEPRRDYWYPPERRLLVGYLSEKWRGRFAPARAVRQMALGLMRHFERVHGDGIVTYQGVDYEKAGGFAAICTALAAHARRLAPSPAWEGLREAWPKLQATAGEDFASYLERVSGSDDWEMGFKARLPWFAYLGATSEEELKARQRFFYGYANLWTTTNAYSVGGAQLFASVLQNNATDVVMSKVREWVSGKTPIATGFRTLGKDHEEIQDRSEYTTVVEVFGFLSLHRAPFYNKLAKGYRAWFGIGGDTDAYELTSRVGAITRAWLEKNPAAIERLTALLRDLIDKAPRSKVEFETIDSPKYRRYLTVEGGAPVDTEPAAELDQEAKADLSKHDPPQLALVGLHLLLDSQIYISTLDTSVDVVPSEPKTPEASPVLVAEPVSQQTRLPAPTEEFLTLPGALRPEGERALAYLRAGLHVLFAGAPGTGKTTLAQFVGHAWDHDLDQIPGKLNTALAPLTTVGNSAWSPFHTIGGLMPAGNGQFKAHRGIFIEPARDEGATWRLRNGAVVLDEMNRADLDRCIGELYPLLSRSVTRVAPAGLPGVGWIEGSPRFRVLATVNDATVDDIVFPISEGLARRFQRIELQGASRDDVFAFLGMDTDTLLDDRRAAASEAVGLFFEVVRDKDLLVRWEDEDRLRFGVGYFALIKAWLDMKLEAPLRDATLKEQARDLLASSLRTLGRTKAWEEALKAFLKRA